MILGFSHGIYDARYIRLHTINVAMKAFTLQNGFANFTKFIPFDIRQDFLQNENRNYKALKCNQNLIVFILLAFWVYIQYTNYIFILIMDCAIQFTKSFKRINRNSMDYSGEKECHWKDTENTKQLMRILCIFMDFQKCVKNTV